MRIVAEAFGRSREPLEFEWDPETGEVSGPGAALVSQAAEEVREQGAIHLHTGQWTEADPLTTREGMAMLIAYMALRVPDSLSEYLPSSPEGARGESTVGTDVDDKIVY